jgi:hypothetical protein
MAAIFRAEINNKQVASSLFLFAAERSLTQTLFHSYTVFSNTIHLCSALTTIDEFACPCRITGITVSIPYGFAQVTGRHNSNRLVERSPEM